MQIRLLDNMFDETECFLFMKCQMKKFEDEISFK